MVWANADYPGRRPSRPQLRRPGHRPVPHRAHVLRAGAPAHRAAHDPGQEQRRPHRGPERAAALPAQRLRRPVRGDDRPAGHHPPDRPAAARVPARRRSSAGRSHHHAGQGRDRWPGREGNRAGRRAGPARVQPDDGPARYPPEHRHARDRGDAGARHLRSGLRRGRARLRSAPRGHDPADRHRQRAEVHPAQAGA